MQKKERSKEMSGAEPTAKNKMQQPAPTEKVVKLRCLRETEMPMVGLFKGGQIIEDPFKIKLIGDNPNFEKFSEEA